MSTLTFNSVLKEHDGNDSEDLANTLNIVNQSDFGLKFSYAAHCDRLQKQDLVYSQQLRLFALSPFKHCQV